MAGMTAQSASGADPASWVRAAGVADVADDDVTGVQVAGLPIALYCAGGQYFATDGICSHEHADLADGFLSGTIIECPKHQGRFDIRTGAPRGAPASTPIRCFAVRRVGDDLLVCLDPQPGQ
jgi:nitrite reductase/ring-hydroxylating ferredoxin subunit